MKLQENADLRLHSTMRLGGRARWLAEAENEADVERLHDWAKQKNLRCLMIGQGSNIVWRDEGFDGLIIVNKIMGRVILAEDKSSVIIRVGGGEDWDGVVAWTVENGWSGIEFMSLVPGTAGAAPVQNVGAYGGEIADVLTELAALDTRSGSFGTIIAGACGFAYRDSRFKSQDKGRFMICNITLRLSKHPPQPPFYEALEQFFKQNSITDFTPATIRQAVIAIRTAKLPDPKKVANNGSFFTNPIVDSAAFEKIKSRYADVVGWPQPSGSVKLAAGWLVEKAGFKGVHDTETGMATWPAQSLVLVNETARTTADLLKFKEKIVNKVQEMFGVVLQQEPELLP